MIRRELRRKQGLLLDVEDLAEAIRALLSVEAREKIGVVRIRRSKRTRRKSEVNDGGAEGTAPAASPRPGEAPEAGEIH